jgi:serine phosphatase RsbU (regulator of sigma subunit)
MDSAWIVGPLEGTSTDGMETPEPPEPLDPLDLPLNEFPEELEEDSSLELESSSSFLFSLDAVTDPSGHKTTSKAKAPWSWLNS